MVWRWTTLTTVSSSIAHRASSEFGFVVQGDASTDPRLHDFFQSALADFAEDSTIEDGLKTLGLKSKDDKIPGAAFTLMPHQVLGVAFMCKREDNKKVPGGLLCDAMGRFLRSLVLAVANTIRPGQDGAVHQPDAAPRRTSE